MKPINLEQCDLVELKEQEMVKIDGGAWWLLAGGAGLLYSAISNFGDIREGIMDGFNGTPRH